LLPYGCNLTDKQIIYKWDKYITGCICQTEWHANLFKGLYPELTNKITIINNGIDVNQFLTINETQLLSEKQSNKFIYSSRPERGLDKLLELWPQILDFYPDAELVISNYGVQPEQTIMNTIKKYNSIKYLGKLNTEQLYSEMKTAEYWLYPTAWPETSCITALEMLMSEVICLYYPVAGLPFTIKDHGIQIASGNEIEKLIKLTTKEKQDLREKGKEYTLSCSWKNRAEEWSNILILEQSINRERINELHNVGFIPKNHVDFLQNLSINFKPKVIYDIGANVLSWTREARKIWTNSEIFVFDAINTAEFLYKENNVKYHIGVLSKEDNLFIKFYENIMHPAGNSYYKEIGHINSNKIYPEEAFTEQIAMTLTSIVKNNKFLLPDLIKIDVQGAELDIIKGGLDVINNAKYLIVELQDTQYNRGAPLAETTIKFLEDNDWELIAPKFCDNGPDADYCFKNKRYDIKLKWAFLIPSWYYHEGLHDYFENLKTLYNIEYTKDIDLIKSFGPTRLTFICEINNDILIYCKDNNIDISLFNTEPLTITYRFCELILNCKKCDNIKIYDYSKSNIKILNENEFTNTEYLPYIITPEENAFLEEINKNTEKIYDFAIISYDNPISCIRRINIVKFLIDNKFTVYIICNKWKKERDIELAKCKVILNIHGQFLNTPSNIFEHIRCDRLLEAGYKILSEDSYCLDPFYIEKYKENLQIINYKEFFNLKTYTNIDLITKLDNLNLNLNLNLNTIGFIMLRHVNNEHSNKYWQHSYDCIRTFYPENLILIVDDNSNYDYITEKELYKTTIINSEYPKRAELLPYYYYLKNKYFDIAVLIHDSIFINTYINFAVDKYKIIWDFQHLWNNTNEDELLMINLFNDPELLTFYKNKSLWNGCFGGMSIITHDYLTLINSKYNLDLLLNVVLNRHNRCSFERVIGCLLQKEYVLSVLLGDIHEYCKWGITFNEKDNHHLPITKVWSGR
jgi:FkbM family methyltransferase